MKIKEESSFLQGVESRLDSLFAEDTEPIKDKDSSPPQVAVKEDATELKEDIQEVPSFKEESSGPAVSSGQIQAQEKSSFIEDIHEIPSTKEKSPHPSVSSDDAQMQEKSSFINEIEKRFSAIFGDEDKETIPYTETKHPDDMKHIIAAAEQEPNKTVAQTSDDLSSPASSIFNSPLKDMKSIVLSIEWEINDHILEQFEEEVNKLYLLYTGDRIVQGFLRILRFLGRYIRVRGVSSNQNSINLLLSVYDNLEKVMVSEGMTDAKKHIILIENIRKYRSWVEDTDLETIVDKEALKTKVDETIPLRPEPSENKFLEDQKAEAKPFADSHVSEEKPFADTAINKIRDEEMPTKEDSSKYLIKEPDVLVQTKPTHAAEVPLPTGITPIESVITAIKNLPPHEAYAYALEEIKKTFQAELDTMKEEIRLLKNAR
jgi:hypothetical protein